MAKIKSANDIRSDIERLRRRKTEIESLDPSSLTKYDSRVDALQASLDEAYYKTFGGVNDRYNRYRRTIYWAQDIPSFGGGTSEAEYRTDVVRGKNETLTMLDAALAMLNEELLDTSPDGSPAPQGETASGIVFIGHGRSPLWRELKDFLETRLTLKVVEFNSVPTAGVATAERLTEMLQSASFAFLLMTAEDAQPDGKTRARENVVHEVGLFQGRLGFKRAIILLEDGCEEFSNIHGLGQIRFPKNAISSKFEEIRLVLEREKITSS
ncbi:MULTISPECIES: nucleotide-binding protein [Bradyrhizobium]|jgi:predicted nucleotide-binding protein|uniref:nucleotide-binding protein n=1 Tax=Bradyrhizobium elkanii TaxID=29448 RepID=UPI0027145693|nr:nucleotide-binding protein [Bradyrhizobium elkanii]WLA51680.1 nucleotide-binding protein [Bradyrhizobium elkanii]WLB78014.1 nucleotide-binding protein [Bradyrhizobium elkanii]